MTATPLPAATLDAGPKILLEAIEASPYAGIEIARPALAELPFRDLIEALLGRQAFKLDFNRLTPAEAIDLVSDKLLGPGTMVAARSSLAAEIGRAAEAVAGLASARPAISIRTSFAPGDLVWHVDRVRAHDAFRLVWPLGRPAGMQLTPRSNIDVGGYRQFMRREYPLLTRLDTRALRSAIPPERLWAHRPAELQAMRDGDFPFVRDTSQIVSISPGAASLHRVETPNLPGAFHRSDWANRHQPGFQIVMTVEAAQ